jgi:single-strand DNA-binding protein
MINEVTLVGRIGKKDIKKLKNGSNMACFSLATSKKYKGADGEKKTYTTWHNVNFYNNLADAAHKYIEIGNLVFIKGEINNVSIAQADGQARWYSSIHASTFKILPTQARTEESCQSMGFENSSEAFSSEEIPF